MTIQNQDADPKYMVTPLAFQMAPELLYVPLASPLKRFLAMFIDALFVAVLAEQAGFIFIFFVGLTLSIQKKSRELGKLFQWFLYLVMLFMLLVTVNNLVSPATSSEVENGNEGEELGTMKERIVLLGSGSKVMSLYQCEDIECAENELIDLITVLKESNVNNNLKSSVLINLVNDLSFSSVEKNTLLDILNTELPQYSANMTDIGDVTANQWPDKKATYQMSDNNSSKKYSYQNESRIEQESDDKYSLLEWTKGLLNDLGLGFGWAALYFTVFTACFDGQTLGKKLFRIRVVQLDGTELSFWCAFVRYGGYGAGFATGLLGFLQIYWDANRQAIQDKISATVVIDLSQSRVNRNISKFKQ
ncbi:RDD family protein [Shewanella sp. VB17]|nr:RDD family protein [Shewanella sp. VB17]